ncbi:MAG: hypothetical protein QM528_06185 [Phycisphaerales bacterium]|nr:hypothetical protein [Phycisphaerales bacterium]
MPIAVPNIPAQYRPSIEHSIQYDSNGTKSNDDFVHPKYVNRYSANTVFNCEQCNDDNKYLKLKLEIQKQIKSKKEYHQEWDTKFIENEFDRCTNALLSEIRPDLISVELTSEQSLFYILKKKSFTLFFQYFLSENEFDSNEEALLSIFNDDEKLPSREGDINSVISFAKEIVSK